MPKFLVPVLSRKATDVATATKYLCQLMHGHTTESLAAPQLSSTYWDRCSTAIWKKYEYGCVKNSKTYTKSADPTNILTTGQRSFCKIGIMGTLRGRSRGGALRTRCPGVDNGRGVPLPSRAGGLGTPPARSRQSPNQNEFGFTLLL